jgi:DNA-binding MarR family transcriptional regulator
MNEVLNIERQALLDGLAENWKPAQIREMGASLLRLADSLDQAWDDSSKRPMFRWPNALSRVERNALNLAMKAREIYQHRRRRNQFIPAQFLGEPSWDMMLELFMQFAGGAKVSTTSLCIASDVPSSTALRHIAQLEEAGLVKRSTSEFDKRVTFIELTDQGVLAVGRYLEEY